MNYQIIQATKMHRSLDK